MRALFLCIALFILNALPALATDVLILQSSQSPAYMEALRGFRSAFTGSSNTIVIADYAEVDAVRLVKEERPRLVLAVGDTALAACRKVRQVPVVSLMSLSLTLAKTTSPNIGGVGVVASPDRFLNLFKALGAGRVGVLYDPDKSSGYLKRAQQVARRLGIDLVTREVGNPRETIGRLEQLKGSVDALWMLPDTTAVTVETLDAYFRFSLEQHLPLITFAAQYLVKGALAALEADRLDLGSVVVEQVSRLLGRDREPMVADPRKLRLSTNTSVARKLGIPISDLERIALDTGE
jgi:putative ABC transport system substrate-binding protein